MIPRGEDRPPGSRPSLRMVGAGNDLVLRVKDLDERVVIALVHLD